MRYAVRALTLAALFAASLQVAAQSWPAKPVRLILSHPVGASPDLAARLLTPPMAEALGQQIVIDNRPGGQFIIGTQLAARAPADGYHFFYGTTVAITAHPYTIKALPYDPARDFIPGGMIARSPFMLAVHPSVPATTLAELVALAKAQPGKLAFASDGVRAFSGLVGDMFQAAVGVKFLHVPYPGVTQAAQDTVAGRTQVTPSWHRRC